MTARRVAALAVSACALAGAAFGQDWPGFNRTLTSERFAALDEIRAANVAGLKRLCVYDFGAGSAFETGPVVIGRTMYVTTDTDTAAIDADSCKELWRVKEGPQPGIRTNRGVAYADGRLFRGMQDGRVIALDARDGHKLWETVIVKAPRETVPAAPIAWGGLVFIGNAGGDAYEVKGRMYGLDAATGKVVWETYLVPKGPGDRAMEGAPDAGSTWRNAPEETISGGATWTSYTLDPATGILYVPGANPSPDFLAAVRKGENLFTNTVVALDAKTGAYRTHYPILPEDFHDWDVSAAPTVFDSRKGRRILAEATKDGHLYGFDLASGRRLYKVPVTTIFNADAPLTATDTRFCPGTKGGTEWNGPAYSPATGLIYTGTTDWCSTIRLIPGDATKLREPGKTFTGADGAPFGFQDKAASGWLTATDADTGARRWRVRTPAPIVSGVTPTSGGLVFFGDIFGNAYALDAKSGRRLWQAPLDGAVGGGVITYAVEGKQRVAFATGLQSTLWPIAKKDTAKIVVYGLR